MRVSELKPGMLLKPKEGAHFRLYRDTYRNKYSSLGTPGADANVEHMECCITEKKYRRIAIDNQLAQKPIIYIGKAPKEHADNHGYYEYRHRVFVPALGREMRMASEHWRNVEEVK